MEQEQNETIPDLGNRIRTLARKAYPEIDAQLRDYFARNQCVRALTNVDITLKLRHNMPDTLDDPIRMAIYFQTVEIDVRKDKKVIYYRRRSMCYCHTGILSDVNDDGSFDFAKGRSRGVQKKSRTVPV